MKSTEPLSEAFPRMGKKQREGFDRLGITTVLELLYHLPTRYVPISAFEGTLTPGETITVTGTIIKIQSRRSFGRRKVLLCEAQLQGEEGVVPVTWYNQHYLVKKFSAGQVVTLTGKVAQTKRPYLVNPTISLVTNKHSATLQEEKEIQTLRPIYPETTGITSVVLSEKIKQLLTQTESTTLPDPIPEVVRKRYKLPELHESFLYIHLPRTSNEYLAAKKRFIFEKVLLLQIRNNLLKHKRSVSKARPLKISSRNVTSFMNTAFPFTPTQAQKRVVREILGDLKKSSPMARLLEGDVGSGKTAVAAAILYGSTEKIESDHPQIAYLAPTEVLARQQFDSLVSLFKNTPVQLGLLSGSTCLKYPSKVDPTSATAIAKAQLKKWIASGELSIIIGTHAVIQKDVAFKNLSLVIIDEQHRFGVAQRKQLLQNIEKTPHLLSMTATPIPRTLALSIHGDLSFSALNELPKGRKTVNTVLLQPQQLPDLYAHIRDEVTKGHQAYILCPIIEETDSPLRSVEEEYANLTNTVFPDYSIAMLHGKLKPKEKQTVMNEFSSGQTQILVCTTVIEVGVNIPNATIIGILHAERFGLAQLHQLRGRVLRSSFQPHCYAVSWSENPDTLARLQLFTEIYDGFTLAKKDLEMRGSGELDGLRQSGVPDLVMEGLQNPELLSFAQKEAEQIVSKDPTLSKHPHLQHYLAQFLTQRE